ncbi:MAG TPA: ATPase domain-containing protein [Thermoplasmata archaeon]|nr:ATPase domain-containing protein [Thermoplasmata archaeon]
MVDETPILGIPEIDQPLSSALPMGWLALLKGSTGAGSSVLAKQFAHAGVGTVPVLFYTTYERTEDVRQSFTDFGWDPDGVKIVNLADEYYERVLVRGLEVAKARERGLGFEGLVREQLGERPATTFRLTDRMLADLQAIDAPFRLVVDSIDFFFEILAPRDVTTVARQIRHRCQTIGGQALITLHTSLQDRATAAVLQDLADVVLDLRAEPEADHYAHTLSVEKVGHRPNLTRIWKASLGETGWGVRAPESTPR